MKILFLDQFSDFGGAQKGLLDLLPAVGAAGWFAEVALPGGGPLIEQVRVLGGKVHSLPNHPYRSHRRSLAVGVPIVAFATGGIPEAVVDGGTGFLVDPPTPNELATRILTLLRNTERLRAVAEAGRLAWRERFTLENYQRRVTQIISTVSAEFRA